MAPSAVHARQSDMQGLPHHVCLLVPEIEFWAGSCEFDHQEVLMFYLVKKALWIFPQGKDDGHLAPLVPIH